MSNVNNLNPYDNHLLRIAPNQTEMTENQIPSKITEAYNNVINEIIQDNDLENNPPPNPLIPAHLRLDKIRNEVKAELEAHLKDFPHNAMQILSTDGKICVESEEYELMNDQLSYLPTLLEDLDYDQIPETNFKTLTELDDEVISTIFKIAQWECRNKNLDASMSIFALLNVLVPEDADYSYRLGCIAYETDKLDLAVIALNNAISIDPDFFESRVYLINTYLKLNELQKAKVELEILENSVDISSLDHPWPVVIAQLKVNLQKV